MKHLTPTELLTGILWQDLQHGVFFGKIAEVRQAVQTGKAEVITGVLAALETYALDHFTLEEAYMLQTDYPESKGHQAEHQRFEELVLAAKSEWRAIQGKQDWREVAEDLSAFLEFWLKRHICHRDQVLAPHIQRASLPV